jgi:phosphocarrier protein FPr
MTGPADAVGLVVVSHSRALARAAVALAAEMVHGRPVRIAVAAGLDDATFGTDAVRIKQAVEEVDGPGGVVVLMDLGSAVLSAELALDLLDDPTARDRVVLSPAPLVEGLVVAAVAAAGGAGRREVAAEARTALMGKAAHLVPPEERADPVVELTAAPEVVGVFTVDNAHGLHARPAARLVGEVRALDATVTLANLTAGTAPVPGASLSRVATLAALRGHQVEVRAVGPQAHEAVEHVLALAARRFDELDDAGDAGAPPVPDSPAATGQPLPASPGVAVGPARRLGAAPVASDAPATGDAGHEWRRVAEAVAEVRREVERLRASTVREVGGQEARIFDAHLMLLGDDELLGDVRRRVTSGAAAARAWYEAVQLVERQWAALPDPYLRARAEDVRAVGEQVLRVLTGAPAVGIDGVGIVVARELSPEQAAELDASVVRGVVLAFGSPTSHAAILARSRGIPAVVAVGPRVLAIEEGTTLALDGGTGELVVDPAPEVLARFEERAADLERQGARFRAEAAAPARTVDGACIEIAANVGSVADARLAAVSGADSVGLLRTEFLFVGRDVAPTVDEQTAEYAAVAAALGGRRVTVRTLDVGGDKPLAYVRQAAEENPYLGQRGLRLSLARPELFRDQLAAICAVARTTPVDVMFPMVTSVAELLRARSALAEAAGVGGPPRDLRVGIMVEVPAAALTLAAFLPYVDFVSIGTNDLTQYTAAAERGNPSVAALADPLEPAVLRLVQLVCDAAHGVVPVAVCGEVAADEAAVPLLLGLGVDELSVAPQAVPWVKGRVRGLDRGECRRLATTALRLADAQEVRALVAREPLAKVPAEQMG